MKIVILITVIESLAVTFAIMYFYYRRSQSENADHVAMARINSEDSHRFADGTSLSFRKANGEGETLKSKKVDQQTLVQYTAR